MQSGQVCRNLHRIGRSPAAGPKGGDAAGFCTHDTAHYGFLCYSQQRREFEHEQRRIQDQGALQAADVLGPVDPQLYAYSLQMRPSYQKGSHRKCFCGSEITKLAVSRASPDGAQCEWDYIVWNLSAPLKHTHSQPRGTVGKRGQECCMLQRANTFSHT